MKRTLSLLVAVLMVVGLASALAIGSAATEYQLPAEYNGEPLNWEPTKRTTLSLLMKTKASTGCRSSSTSTGAGKTFRPTLTAPET